MQFLQKKLSNFSILDNAILQDGGLSLEARGLYAYMVSLPNDWQFSYDRLAKANNVGLRVIRRVIAELENAKLLKREFTTTNKGSVVKYILFDSKTREQNATLQIATLQNATSQNATPYKELIDTKKESNKELITNSETKKFDFLDFAKELYDNSPTKPQIALDLWLKYVDSKAQAIKKKRGKSTQITERMLNVDFNALFKLQEIGYDVKERVEKAIDLGYQSIWFDSDTREWTKKGGHFRNNVGHLDYNQTNNPNNPLAKIETFLDLGGNK